MKIRLALNIVSLFIIVMSFFSCSGSTFNASLDSLIIPPKVERVLAEGTWIVENFYYMNVNSGVNPEIPLNSYLFLSREHFRINNVLFEFENHKVKTTNLSDYMRVKFKMNDFSFLNLADKEIKVLSVQDKNKNVYEFLQYDEETLLLYYDDDIMYIFKKVSDKIDESLEDFVKNNFKNNIYNNNNRDINDVGFLISFRSERKVVDSSVIPKNEYKTIWFYQNNNGTYSYKILKDIIVPKNGELFRVGVEVSEKNSSYEKIFINNLSSQDNQLNLNMDNSNEEFINQFIDITYVNENYIGINYDQNTEYLGRVNTNKLAMLSIEAPYIDKRLKFSDIFGNNKDEFYTSRDKIVELIGKDGLEMYDSEIREDSFKLFRYAGSWYLRGRINPKIRYNAEPIDFDINILPNKKLVRNNDLSVNLGQIKLKQQDAIDVFVSPNYDIMVILTKENIYIHRVINDKISNNTIGEFDIKKDDQVILSEWYTNEEASRINQLLEGIE